MDQRAYARQLLAQREAGRFTDAVTDLTAAHPHPHGPSIRITLTGIADGEDLGTVDIDVTNLWAIARAAEHRATSPTPTGRASRPTLRVVGGAR